MTTAAGVIVADTKHWSGTLRLDGQGKFTAGANHPGNAYRQKSISTLAFLADQVQGADVSCVLVIVDGGSVEGGLLSTTMNGYPVIAVERQHAVDAITSIHMRGTLPAVPDMRVIDRSSPKLKLS